MKLISLFVFTLLLSQVNTALAMVPLRWSQVDSSALQVLLQDAKDIVREGESLERFSALSPKSTLGFFLLETAFAENPAYDCFLRRLAVSIKNLRR